MEAVDREQDSDARAGGDEFNLDESVSDMASTLRNTATSFA